jgi:GNAT superfamily N-acetyltransferase
MNIQRLTQEEMFEPRMLQRLKRMVLHHESQMGQFLWEHDNPDWMDHFYGNKYVRGYLATDNGEDLGWTMIESCGKRGIGFVNVFVRPKHRRKGVGTTLVNHARRESKVVRVFPFDSVGRRFYAQWQDIQNDGKDEA